LCEIYFEQPWNCGGEDNCTAAGHWHKRTYWVGNGEYTCDEYSDGDHDVVEADEMPTLAEVEASWCEYAEWVVDNAQDPLGNYYVRRSVKTEELWYFRFSHGINGPVLHAARRRDKQVSFGKLPDHVRQYLNLTPRGRLDDFLDWESFEKAVPGVKPLRWFPVKIEWDKPRTPTIIRFELRRAARRHLRQARKEVLNAAA